jgi:hypothetical protein
MEAKREPPPIRVALTTHRAQASAAFKPSR